jgi:hypothetical protein
LTDPSSNSSDKALIARLDWSGAIALLKSAALRDTRNADIQNYIGYGYRRLLCTPVNLARYGPGVARMSRTRATGVAHSN